VKTLKKKLRESVLPMLLVLVLSMVMSLIGTVSFAQTNSTTTVYIDPPTITGVTVGEEFTVDIKIRDALNVSMWGAGLAFNPDVLECTGFEEGTFLSNVGSTLWSSGTIDNTAGLITAHACNFLGVYKASGDGQLAYLTFTVKAPEVSDLHLRDVAVAETVWDPNLQIYVPKAIPFNIVDVYTAVVDTTPHTVVTVSNSTGKTGTYGSFKVTTPKTFSFSNVSIPKNLLFVDNPDDWKVFVDGTPVSRTVTYNGTHYFIYFTYGEGVHTVQITSKRDLAISLDAPAFLLFDESTVLNATVHNLGVNDEANVTLQLLINGGEANSTIIL